VGQRVVIVDFNHMVHTYANSSHRLSEVIDGERVDTTIQSGTIKAIHKWSRGGCNPTAVCFDSPVAIKKSYFAEALGMDTQTEKEYKGGRKGLGGDIYETMDAIKKMLMRSGVSCYKAENYEADDLISACVDRAKEQYPGMPIDIITNDADILPLVDEQVSVFLRSKKMTWAESKELIKPKYVQVKPENLQEVVEGMSAFKGFKIPYNTVLLHKLLRGDSSDNINTDSVKEVSKLFPPKKFNEMIDRMEEANVDFSKLFRYGKNEQIFIDKDNKPIAPHKLGRYEQGELQKIYLDPKELTNMAGILSWYYDFGNKVTDEEKEELIQKVTKHIEVMYRGMNLNGRLVVNGGEFIRNPAQVKQINTFEEYDLQKSIKKWGITLSLGRF
jgi:DNA polymerase-1